MTLLPPTLGGAPSQPLDLGRATRVISPAQRAALAVRDRGCVFPGCDRPLAWCEGHHLWHWIDGGPTDLWKIWPWCAGPITGRSMRAAGTWPAAPMGGSRPSPAGDDIARPPDRWQRPPSAA